MSVAAALAEAHHHSAPKVGAETHDALRRQKTASAGARPGVLKDPAPQGAVTVSYVAAPGPLLSTPLLADAAAEAVDARAVKFLLQKSLARKKKEEEERKKEEEEKEQFLEQSMQELRLLSKTPVAGRSLQQANRVVELLKLRDAASSSSSKRKRKKRRKKKLPRGRARRRQRQRPLSGALIVDSGSGMCRAGFPSSRCVPFGCRQAPDARHHGRYGPEGLVCWFFSMLLALCSLLCLQAQDARLHGRLGPQDSWSLTGAVLGQGFLHARCCAMCGVLVQTVQYWRFRSCSSSWSSSLPVVLQRQIPMVLLFR